LISFLASNSNFSTASFSRPSRSALLSFFLSFPCNFSNSLSYFSNPSLFRFLSEASSRSEVLLELTDELNFPSSLLYLSCTSLYLYLALSKATCNFSNSFSFDSRWLMHFVHSILICSFSLLVFVCVFLLTASFAQPRTGPLG
jgi:hypothetical protein